jgi:hypothetical protein
MMAGLTPLTGSIGALGAIGMALGARSSINIVKDCFKNCVDPSTTYSCAMSMSDATFSAMALHIALLIAMAAAAATTVGWFARRLLKDRWLTDQ